MRNYYALFFNCNYSLNPAACKTELLTFNSKKERDNFVANNQNPQRYVGVNSSRAINSKEAKDFIKNNS